MKYFAYLRVSGKSQIDGDGPERQAESISGFCKQRGCELSGTYFEAGFTGTQADRPVLNKLLAVAETGDAVIVERLDRLARDLLVQECILKEFRERGLLLYAADQGWIDLVTNDGEPTRKLIRQFLGALAEWEKSALVLKLKKARDRKRAETGRCGGPLPYGSTPQEAVVLATARTLRQNGHSFSQVGLALEKAGFVPRSGGHWHKSSVAVMLSR